MPRWTKQSRQQQRERILHQRPWLQATGPVTPYGKRVASRNAVKNKKPLSQQLHSAFTPPCENAAEMSPDVAFMSLQTNEGDTDQPLEIGDRAEYTGFDPAIASICGGKLLEVFAIRESWAICWVTGVAGLITVRVEDLKNATLG